MKPLWSAQAILGAAVLAAGCGDPGDALVGTGVRPITGGATDNGDPAIVGLQGSDLGLKRQGQGKIQKVESLRVFIGGPQDSCDGDSGGPALYPPGDGEAVIGTVSGNEQDNCNGDWYGLVAPDLEWIAQQGVTVTPGQGLSPGGGTTGPGSPSPSNGASPGGVMHSGNTGCQASPATRGENATRVLLLLLLASVFRKKRRMP